MAEGNGDMEVLFWIGGIVVGLFVLISVLGLIIWLAFGSLITWQASIIFILMGGFIGGGVGAIVGFVLSGCIGLFYAKFLQEPQIR